MNKAAIDIGRTSYQLLIIDNTGRIICDEMREEDLGFASAASRMLPPAKIRNCINTLQELAEIARLHNIPAWRIQAVATAAMSSIFNAKTILARIREHVGLNIRILSPEEEASFAWQGGSWGLKLPAGPVGVINLSASNLDAVMGDPDRLIWHHSIQIGSTQLTEEFLGVSPRRYNIQQLARMRNVVEEKLQALQWPVRPRALIAVGGISSALAAMEQGLPHHDPLQIHGLRLSRGSLRKWMDRLLESSPEQRQALCPAYPGRVDWLLAGATILECTCTASMRDSLLVSTGGIRLGVLLDMLQREAIPNPDKN